MAVTINSVTPGSNNVKLGWDAVPMALNSAILYVAANQADLNTPNGMSAPADQSAILPTNPLTATIPGLASGTNYFCQASADGNMSAVQSFTTTGAVAPIAHLDANGHHGHFGVHYEVRNGDSVELKVHTLKIGDPKTKLPGITVNFSITAGQANGQLVQTSAVSNAHGTALVAFKGIQIGQAQVTASSPQADNQVVLDIRVHA